MSEEYFALDEFERDLIGSSMGTSIGRSRMTRGSEC